MGDQGKAVIRAGGKAGIGPDGKLKIFDSVDECPECCDCCDMTVTATINGSGVSLTETSGVICATGSWTSSGPGTTRSGTYEACLSGLPSGCCEGTPYDLRFEYDWVDFSGVYTTHYGTGDLDACSTGSQTEYTNERVSGVENLTGLTCCDDGEAWTEMSPQPAFVVHDLVFSWTCT